MFLRKNEGHISALNNQKQYAMPVNLAAHNRHRIINARLRRRDISNKWKDLAIACYMELKDQYKSYKVPSRSTIFADLQYLRDTEHGYGAVIENINGSYHYYDPQFSIEHVRATPRQVDAILQAFILIKQLTQNDQLANIKEVVSLLEKKLTSSTDKKLLIKPIIYFEESTNYPSHQWIDDFYDLCYRKETCRISYQPFNDNGHNYVYSPYYLKEYNNRWYIIAYCHEKNMIFNLALDRIISITRSFEDFDESHYIDHSTFYNEIIGVSKDDKATEDILIKVSALSAKYLDTKPLHHSQQKFGTEADGCVIFSFKVIPNYEFYYKVLAFGPNMEIIKPVNVRNQIAVLIDKMKAFYDTP